MRTVGWLIKELSKFPYDAECYACEGEVVGISIRVDCMQKAFIHCSESDGDPDTTTSDLISSRKGGSMTLRDKFADEINFGGCNHPIIASRKYEIADALLNLPELKEKLEKADKWDDTAVEFYVATVRAKALDLIMDGLEVGEKCNQCHGTMLYTLMPDGEIVNCEDCDNGYISRPATPEEFREFVLAVFNEIDLHGHLGEWERVTETGFTLKSGAVLRLKK